MNSNYLALDVGAKRIGVARANSIARLASPLRTINNDENVWSVLGDLIRQEQAGYVIVGLPRNLSGDDTAQTAVAREFAEQVRSRFGVEVSLQDEALTSHKAEMELSERKGGHTKGDIDALAATYILEDYLAA